MKKKILNKRGSGFIQIALLIVIALVILKYVYDIDVVGFLTTGKPKEWLDWLFELWSKVLDKIGPWVLKGWSYVFDWIKNLLDK